MVGRSVNMVITAGNLGVAVTLVIHGDLEWPPSPCLSATPLFICDDLVYQRLYLVSAVT